MTTLESEVSRIQPGCERMCEPNTAADIEWLDANGRGGYASLSAAMAGTRRQHGLLVAVPPGLQKRHVFVARIEETLTVGDHEVRLGHADYVDYPAGDILPVRIQSWPYPCFEYTIEGHQFVRQVMSSPDPGVLVRYSVEGTRTAPIHLRLRVMLACRDADASTHENITLRPGADRIAAGLVVVQPYAELPGVRLGVTSNFVFEPDPVWYRKVAYRRDHERGYGEPEDQFSPGYFEGEFRNGRAIVVGAQLTSAAKAWATPADIASSWSNVRRRRTRSRNPGSRARSHWLELAAESYLYQRVDGSEGIIAGYPWFGEWGRDTFIALPGLTLARGQVRRCGDILRGVLPRLQHGLLPNTFGETEAGDVYRSADAGLWFARAIELFDAASGRRLETARVFLPVLKAMIAALRDGHSSIGYGCDDTGMLAITDPQSSLTWMDVRVYGQPVTPRHGCPVELNALWYALLLHTASLARRIGDRPEENRLRDFAEQVGEHFMRRLWLDDEQYLADRWIDDQPDRQIRPNMVFAAALPESPLSDAQRSAVIARADAELVTPCGLRTLSPADPDYCPRYEGDGVSRDRAYHQGTVWPWLVGAWVEAHLRVDASETNMQRLLSYLREFDDEQRQVCVGQVPEIFDGSPPQRPRGAIAQAWSVGELLRARALIVGATR